MKAKLELEEEQKAIEDKRRQNEMKQRLLDQQAEIEEATIEEAVWQEAVNEEENSVPNVKCQDKTHPGDLNKLETSNNRHEKSFIGLKTVRPAMIINNNSVPEINQVS